MDIAIIALLTFFASGAGTLTRFGTSTIMVPEGATLDSRLLWGMLLGLVALTLLVFP